MLSETYHGLCEIEFTNGKTFGVNIDKIPMLMNGDPLGVIDIDGTMYNWAHIVSMKRRNGSAPYGG